MTPPVAAIASICRSERLRGVGQEAAGVGVGGDDRPVGELHHIREALVVQVGDVDQHPEGERLFHQPVAEGGEPRLLPLRLVAVEGAVRGKVAAAPAEPHHPHAQLIKDRQQLLLVPERLHPLEGEEQGDLPRAQRGFDLGIAAAEGQLGGLPELGVEGADLTQRLVQGPLGRSLPSTKREDTTTRTPPFRKSSRYSSRITWVRPSRRLA